MNILLITGSRVCTREMEQRAESAVWKAQEKGYSIIVGDAIGIDFAVVSACNALGVPYVCYGVTTIPRQQQLCYPYIQIHFEGTWPERFLARNRHMADLANECLAIWDGKSRGTLYTYKYFKSLGKLCWLLDFSRPKGKRYVK